MTESEIRDSLAKGEGELAPVKRTRQDRKTLNNMTLIDMLDRTTP